jgi:hypothetical protein
MGETPNLQPTATVPLQFPIKVKGQEVKELVIKRPTVGMLMQLNDLGLKISGGSTEITGLGRVAVKAIAHMAGITEAEAQSLDLLDLAEIAKAASGFFGSSLLTGLIS